MECQKTISGRSDSSHSTIATDAEVLDMLVEAEAEYEAYVALSKISAYRVPAEKVYEPRYDWSTPMTLVTYLGMPTLNALVDEFNATLVASDEHGSHGRRIGRDAARDEGVAVDDLEDDQSLQEAALTLYHWSTIAFEQGPIAKTLIRNTTPLQRRRRKNCHHHR